jgi:surface polysaccharide O-acyltransferase-like enzyme
MKPPVDFLIPIIVVAVMLVIGAGIFWVGSGAVTLGDGLPYHSWFLEMLGGACAFLGLILFHDFYLR